MSFLKFRLYFEMDCFWKSPRELELSFPIQNLLTHWLRISKNFSETVLSLYLYPLYVSLKKMKWRLVLSILMGQLKLGYIQISDFPNFPSASCGGYYYAPYNNINPATNYSSDPLVLSPFCTLEPPGALKTTDAQISLIKILTWLLSEAAWDWGF